MHIVEAQLNSICFFPFYFLICSCFLRIQLMMQSIVGGCMALAQEWLRNRTKMWTQPRRKWAFWPLSTTCSHDKRYRSAEQLPCRQLLSSIIFPNSVSNKRHLQHTACRPAVLLKSCIFIWNPEEELTEFLMPAFVVCHLFNTKGKRQNLLCIPLFFSSLYCTESARKT